MTTTLELINAISQGDAVEVENAFNTAMAEKIAGKIDDLRANVAQSFFNSQQPEVSTEEPPTNEEE
jgi:hypothetical protein